MLEDILSWSRDDCSIVALAWVRAGNSNRNQFALAV
jgi:hypothetical protein